MTMTLEELTPSPPHQLGQSRFPGKPGTLVPCPTPLPPDPEGRPPSHPINRQARRCPSPALKRSQEARSAGRSRQQTGTRGAEQRGPERRAGRTLGDKRPAEGPGLHLQRALVGKGEAPTAVFAPSKEPPGDVARQGSPAFVRECSPAGVFRSKAGRSERRRRPHKGGGRTGSRAAEYRSAESSRRRAAVLTRGTLLRTLSKSETS